MPTFCRHNRLIQNCPICSREQAIEARPIVSSSAPRSSQPRPPGTAGPRSGGGRGSRSGSSRPATGLRVRRLVRGAEDGFSSPLVPGLHSSADAERLADEFAFATARLQQLSVAPPGLYAEIADPAGDIEERTWLAFLVAYLSPLEDEQPFASIEAARTTWASGEAPHLDGVQTGPRTAHEPGRGTRTIDAYRAWAQRAGSQHAAFAGETLWSPERRFARVFERMALPGLHRDARFDLLVTLGRLDVFSLTAGSLQFGGENETTLAAKRALGIGDSMLLERRAADLADACGVPLAALDLGLYNWGRGTRVTAGVGSLAETDEALAESARAALGL